MTLMAVWMGLGALGYITGDPAHLDPVFRPKYNRHLTLVLSHGISSILALTAGPWQFWKRLRTRRRGLHRVLGYLYLSAIAVGASTGWVMGLMAEGGVLARVGFCLADGLWLFTDWSALQSARQHDFLAHRRWMIRSYALTFGAVWLRLFLYGLRWLGYDFNAIYPYISWLSWSTSLGLGEFILEGENHEKEVPPRSGLAPPGSNPIGLHTVG